MGTAALGARRLFGSDAVCALSVAALEGFHRRSPLLPECAAQKAADRVGLPSGRLRDSCKVTPPGRFSRSTILAVLLPRRARVAFLARGAFRAGLPLDGATGARGLATRAFVAVPGTFSFCSCGIEVVISAVSFGGSRHVTTFIALFAHICKRIL